MNLPSSFDGGRDPPKPFCPNRQLFQPPARDKNAQTTTPNRQGAIMKPFAAVFVLSCILFGCGSDDSPVTADAGTSELDPDLRVQLDTNSSNNRGQNNSTDTGTETNANNGTDTGTEADLGTQETEADLGTQDTGNMNATDTGIGGNDSGTADTSDLSTSPDEGADASTPTSTETCVNAPTLSAVSTPIAQPRRHYTQVLTGPIGSQNDYNPYRTSGLPPACSPVFDALGNDVVYEVTLLPGQTLHTRLSLTPASAIPAIYIIEGCPVTGWPDIDESTLCGDNEYATNGFCFGNNCDPLEWSFTWPTAIGGIQTDASTFYLVVDEVTATNATDFSLEWSIVDP
jgi:hypothetical protein